MTVMKLQFAYTLFIFQWYGYQTFNSSSGLRRKIYVLCPTKHLLFNYCQLSRIFGLQRDRLEKNIYGWCDVGVVGCLGTLTISGCWEDR